MRAVRLEGVADATGRSSACSTSVTASSSLSMDACAAGKSRRGLMEERVKCRLASEPAALRTSASPNASSGPALLGLSNRLNIFLPRLLHGQYNCADLRPSQRRNLQYIDHPFVVLHRCIYCCTHAGLAAFRRSAVAVALFRTTTSGQERVVLVLIELGNTFFRVGVDFDLVSALASAFKTAEGEGIGALGLLGFPRRRHLVVGVHRTARKEDSCRTSECRPLSNCSLLRSFGRCWK